MTRSHPAFHRTTGVAALALVAALVSPLAAAAAQPAADTAALGEQLRDRFDIRALQRGLSLIPKTSTDTVRVVDIVDGTVSINGEVVSGREIEERLGRDAPLVVRLSYLTDDQRRELLALPAPGEGAAPPAPAPAPALPPLPPVPPRGRRSDRVRIIGDASVAADERLEGDVVVVGGRAQVDGTVDGNVVVVFGRLGLGPMADVRGDVVAVATRFDRAPGSRIGGELVDIGFGNPGVTIRDVEVPSLGLWPRRALPRYWGILATLLRLGLLVILGWMIVAVAGRSVHRIANRAGAEPLKAGVVGLLVEVLFLPVLIVVSILLAVSIVGIPLLVLIPLVLLVMLVALLVGFTAVAVRLGEWMGARVGIEPLEPYRAVALGVAGLLALAFLARVASLPGGLTTGLGFMLGLVAFCVEYVAWTVGLGAAVLVRLGPDLPGPPAAQAPPPMPPPATT